MDETLRIDTYMHAYEIAARRYENIYQSTWTIFSYMSAITAAIFTFAGSRLYIEPLLACGLLPLIYWFLTTYLPLDRYGNASLEDLKRLEKLLSSSGIDVRQFTGFDKKRREQGQQFRRARFWIVGSFILILTAWSVGLALTVQKIYRGYELAPPSPPEFNLRIDSTTNPRQ